LKRIFFTIVIFFHSPLFSQTTDYEHQKFCKNLNKVFELGRKDNFDSYDGTMVKESPFLPVPGYSIKLDEFAVNYVDKNQRFVAKTNLNMDSLSALQKLEELKTYVAFCLDSTQWTKWMESEGDDSTTVFFKELKEARSEAKDMELVLAVTLAAPKVFTVNMYVKRRKQSF
jgi:hypothetical protein